ncbi:putative ABC transport system ATP-binding protein [Salirhabdus euzebyi]|uniref:Putative ABC transport system ATP-binding protein n=1 Tax=Salirhabdus euzebyi TaxID=394506 RepID=A0A841Q8H2_9BACI|nr:ABC transporter ATP-binding protein [Salirhabdus euzebyi]MBB6454708.1 putative ABC transport system ATP-binding protein [Salirhabdus euzebyi]
MLQLNQIEKVFYEGTPDEKRALRGIDLTLNEGDFVTVIGSNGAGKSTLLNIVAGVLFPDYGAVSIDDKEVTFLPEYKRSKWIGRVFQDPMAGTAPNMTIEENLALALGRTKKRSLFKGVTQNRRAEFKELLNSIDIGLEDRLNTKVGLLSGGERQALSLLMATFTKPRILLLDEHTAALDPARAELITRITKDIVAKHQLTTLMVTHQMDQAIQLGNRLFMMDGGQIIFEANDEQKEKLTVEQLINEFQKIRGKQFANDRSVLSV